MALTHDLTFMKGVSFPHRANKRHCVVGFVFHSRFSCENPRSFLKHTNHNHATGENDCHHVCIACSKAPGVCVYPHDFMTKTKHELAN